MDQIITLNPNQEIRDLQSAIVQKQVIGNEIKMLIKKDDTQKLIGFEMPKYDCTVQDLLNEACILHLKDSFRVFLIDDPQIEINYIVAFEETNNVDGPASLPTNCNVIENNPVPAPIVEKSREPIYVSGMLAVCSYCGMSAEDFNYCVRCKRKLPDNVKAVPIYKNSTTPTTNNATTTKEKYILFKS